MRQDIDIRIVLVRIEAPDGGGELDFAALIIICVGTSLVCVGAGPVPGVEVAVGTELDIFHAVDIGTIAGIRGFKPWFRIGGIAVDG